VVPRKGRVRDGVNSNKRVRGTTRADGTRPNDRPTLTTVALYPDRSQCEGETTVEILGQEQPPTTDTGQSASEWSPIRRSARGGWLNQTPFGGMKRSAIVESECGSGTPSNEWGTSTLRAPRSGRERQRRIHCPVRIQLAHCGHRSPVPRELRYRNRRSRRQVRRVRYLVR